MKGGLAILVGWLTLLFYAATLASPWWFFRYTGRPDQYGQCWVDGTCRTPLLEGKQNGAAQIWYLTAEILSILAMLPLLIWFHFILFMHNKHHFIPGSKIWMCLSGCCAFSLLITAIITFAVGLVGTYTIGNFIFYGTSAPWTVTQSVTYDCIPGASTSPFQPLLLPGAALKDVDLEKIRATAAAIPPEYLPIFITSPYGQMLLPNGELVRWGLQAGWFLGIITLGLLLLGLLLGLLMKHRSKEYHEGMHGRGVVEPRKDYYASEGAVPATTRTRVAA